jgi:hypothetical protein
MMKRRPETSLCGLCRYFVQARKGIPGLLDCCVLGTILAKPYAKRADEERLSIGKGGNRAGIPSTRSLWRRMVLRLTRSIAARAATSDMQGISMMSILRRRPRRWNGFGSELGIGLCGAYAAIRPAAIAACAKAVWDGSKTSG